MVICVPPTKIELEELKVENLSIEIPTYIFRDSNREVNATAYRDRSYLILGNGQYYTFDNRSVKNYEPNTRSKEVHLKNPLIIRSDNQWRSYTRKVGWEFPTPFGITKSKLDTLEAINKFLNQLITDDHDGIIIYWDNSKYYDIDKFQNGIKTLRKVFQEPLVFIPEMGNGCYLTTADLSIDALLD